MKTCFIFNPCSGKNRRRPWLVPIIREFIATHRLAAEVIPTVRPGHATELAREALAAGCERVVAVGGDGTMNEVAQALIGAPAALGLVPCGSGNGLALHLGIPTNPRAALGLLADPRARVVAIDTGTANGHPFCNAMGIGFDAEISRRFNRLARRGFLAYARTGLAAYVRFLPQAVTISHGFGSAKRLDVFIVTIANSDQYGNYARIAPQARVDDGVLDLIAIRPLNPLSTATLVARLFTGSVDRSSRVHRMRGRRFVIERSIPGLLHTDGETHDAEARVEVIVRPRSLRIVVPAHSTVARPSPAREKAESQTAREIRSSKLEIRNNAGKWKRLKQDFPHAGMLRPFPRLNFPLCFGFRASDFEF
ncbi:MAG TPA: diacylglycerol kinase family protein [Opitutaceae bacterium]|nr:diacylglycerol kinase family protein [Opitutaceae bacterium]